jgi:hypothetical protein
MKINMIIAAIVVASLYSCGESDRYGMGFTYTINVDGVDKTKQMNAIPLSNFCDSVATIILETTKESLLSNVDKAVIVNDRVYVFDSTHERAGIILEFDMTGKFIRRIGSVGRGPGEYIRIFDFAIDELNGLLYILDNATNRVISYNLENGRYVNDILMKQNRASVHVIAPVGDLIYTDLHNFEYDESNSLLMSWNTADPETKNYYLPVGKHLKGWTNTTLSSNGKFIFSDGNDYTLYSNKISTDVFKLTKAGIENYIHIESENTIDDRGREMLSMATDDDDSNGTNSESYDRALRNIDCFHSIRDYFETNSYIGFRIGRANYYMLYIYNKGDGEVRTGHYDNDLIVTVKSDYGHFPVQALLAHMQADREGLLYSVWTRSIEKLRTAAQEGMLVDGLDRLDELKQLKDDANPVLFYMNFKEPLR